jgi:hypothetical protein
VPPRLAGNRSTLYDADQLVPTDEFFQAMQRGTTDWAGESKLRTDGDKLELTSIPDAEWATVEQAGRDF